MCADADAITEVAPSVHDSRGRALMRGAGSVRSKQQGRAPLAVLVLAVLAHGVVLFLTFVMGLQWGSWTYLAALLQAVLLGGLLVFLAQRRRWLALAVPVISAALSLALFAYYVKVEAAAACTQDMREATAKLTPVPGTKVSFNGEPGNGCIARFTVPASETDEVLPHYQREFTRNGWEITAEEGDVLVATKHRIVMNVEVPEGEGGLVVMVVHHTS